MSGRNDLSVRLKNFADLMEAAGNIPAAFIMREASRELAPANTGLITMDMQAQSTIDAMRAREAAFND